MAAANIASTKIALEPVRRENYKYWSVQVKDYLSGVDLWDTIEGDLNINNEIWKKKNDQALHVIRLVCGYEALDRIKFCKTAKEAWDLLKSIFSEDLKVELITINEDIDKDVDKLHRAVKLGKWDDANSIIINQGNEIIRQTSEYTGLTSVHVAIDAGNKDIMKKLIEIDPKSLDARNSEGYTPIAFVANQHSEEMKIAEWLISEGGNDMLIKEVTFNGPNKGDIPVILAAAKGHKNLTKYLFFKMNWSILFNNNSSYADKLVTLCIHSEIFDVAAALLQHNPLFCHTINSQMALTSEFDSCNKPMLELASKPNVFLSSTQLNMFQLMVYKVLTVPMQMDIEGKVITIGSNDGEANSNVVAGGMRKLLKSHAGALVNGFLMQIPGIKKIYEKKVNHHLAIEVLKSFCERVKQIPSQSKLYELSVQHAMLRASQNGILEFIEMMGKANPNLLWVKDTNKRGIFAHAILNRRKEVFDLIYDIEGRKEFVTATDVFGNNLLHLAAELSHSSPMDRKSNRVVKMQGEFRWFEEIESILPPMFKKAKNSSGVRPCELFSKNHEELVKEGCDWTKKSATSFAVIGTLAMSTTFSTTYGNRKEPFSFFVMAIAFAFITSAASVLLTYAGIITSGYDDEVFIRKVPMKLIYSQINLFLSVAFLLAAFGYELVPQLSGHFAIEAIVLGYAFIHTLMFKILLHPFVSFSDMLPRKVRCFTSCKKTLKNL